MVDWPSQIAPVRRFWEKPSAAQARTLLERGCLWNSFVMVGWASAFEEVTRKAVPATVAALEPAAAALGTPRQAVALERAYAAVPSLGFSERVLMPLADRFSVMRVKDVGWSDLGNPRRVIESARRRGHEPPWLAEASLTA